MPRKTKPVPEQSLRSGIYGIRNIANGHLYIGSASNFVHRWAAHRAQLGKGDCRCTILQRAWSKYGAELFRFYIIERCEVEALEEREQFYMDEVHPEYNIGRASRQTRLGLTNSPESNAKRSESLREQEMREYLSAVRKLIPRTAEWRARQSAAMMGNQNGAGKSPSAEVREKIAAAQRGVPRKPWSAERRARHDAKHAARHQETADRAARDAANIERLAVLKAQAIDLRATGLSYQKIADRLGVSLATAWTWTKP